MRKDGYFSPGRLSDPACQTALSFISRSSRLSAETPCPLEIKIPGSKTAIFISVILVTYNGAEFLYGLCSSLLNGARVPTEVICVDNGSRDRTVDIIRQAFKEAKVLRTGKNIGFSRAANLGARKAAGKYLFFLNQDMEVDPDTLINLFNEAEKRTDAGILGPKIKFAHSPETINSFGIAINRIGYAWDDCLYEIDSERFGKAKESLAVCGGALFIKRELFLSLGGFDERFFMYGEDVDLGLRVVSAGYKNMVVPEAQVFHYKDIFSADTRYFEYLHQKNRWRIVLKHFPPGLLGKAVKRGIRFDLVSLFKFLIRCDLTRFFFRFRALIYTIISLPGLIRKRKISNPLSEKVPRLIKEGYGYPRVNMEKLAQKRKWTGGSSRFRKCILRDSFKRAAFPPLSRVLLLRGPDPGLVNDVYEVLKEIYPHAEVVMLVGDKRKMDFKGDILSFSYRKIFRKFDVILVLRRDAVFKKILAQLTFPKAIFTVDGYERLERVHILKVLKEANPIRLFFSSLNYILKKVLLRFPFYLGEVVFFIMGFRTKKIDKILLIQLGQLGDLVLETPCVEALREKFKNATFVSLAAPWGEEFVRRDPLIDKVIIYNAKWMRPGYFNKKNGKGLFRTLMALWRERIDLAIDFRGEANSIILAYLAGARLRLGYGIRSQNACLPVERVKFLLNLPVEYPWEERHSFHQAEHNLRLLKKLGIEGDYRPRAFFNEEEKEWARGFLRENRKVPLVIIHPGASRIEKAWEAQKFSKVIERLQGEYGAQVVLVGEEGEAALGEIITGHLREKPLVAIGKTTLGKLIALISEADLFIGNESGPMHIAASLSIPTVAIMSGVPSLYGPYKTRASVIQKRLTCWQPWIEHCYCPGNSYQCLKEIEVEDVWRKVKENYEIDRNKKSKL